MFNLTRSGQFTKNEMRLRAVHCGQQQREVRNHCAASGQLGFREVEAVQLA
jgi:hypothetical protein